MSMESMEQKLDDLQEDVSDIKGTLPRSWKKNTNGHDEWNDLCDTVDEMKTNQERWNQSAKWIVGLIGLGVMTTVGLLAEDLYGEVTEGMFDNRPPTRIELERDEYSDTEAFVTNIENGKFDGRLDKIEKIEINNENRIQVLRAIAQRRHELGEHEVE